MSAMRVQVTVNGEQAEADVEPRLLLVHLLREVPADRHAHRLRHQQLRRVHGACSTAAASSRAPCWPSQADGASDHDRRGHGSRTARSIPLQEAFWEEHGLQCGFCTPGHDHEASYALLERRTPTRPRRRSARAISGNLCRCTGYVNIVKAIQHAGARQATRPRAGCAR